MIRATGGGAGLGCDPRGVARMGPKRRGQDETPGAWPGGDPRGVARRGPWDKYWWPPWGQLFIITRSVTRPGGDTWSTHTHTRTAQTHTRATHAHAHAHTPRATFAHNTKTSRHFPTLMNSEGQEKADAPPTERLATPHLQNIPNTNILAATTVRLTTREKNTFCYITQHYIILQTHTNTKVKRTLICLRRQEQGHEAPTIH